MAVTTGLLPHCDSLKVATLLIAIHGIGDGCYNVIRPVWLVEMWPVGNAVLFQTMHFFSAIGQITSPLLMAHYMLGEKIFLGPATETPTQERIPSLSFPLAVSGVLMTVGKCLLGLFKLNRIKSWPLSFKNV